MEIKIYAGCIVLLDEEDFARLGYPRLSVRVNYERAEFKSVTILGRGRSIYLAREIYKLDNIIPEGYVIDHKDRDVLNNQRSNLRLATKEQNNQNTSQGGNGKSGHRGVSWKSSHKCWRADISYKGKREHLGYFKTVEEAAAAYTKAALKYYGEFSPLHPESQKKE